MSINDSIIEHALHKLASLILADVPDYEQAVQSEIQTHIAIFLVDQLNLKEAQLARKWAEIETKRMSRNSV